MYKRLGMRLKYGKCSFEASEPFKPQKFCVSQNCSIMSFDFQSSNMTDREAQAYQKKTFKRGRGKRSQRNKLPPTSCDPETTPPSTEMDPAEDKENMMNLEILGKTYSFVKNSYVCVKRSHPFITKLGNLAEVSHR